MRSWTMLPVLLLAACGPRFETQYSLTPPPDSLTSRQCLQSCEFQRQQCQQLADSRYQLCQSQAELRYDRCQDAADYDYQRCLYLRPDNPGSCRRPSGYCFRDYCARDDANCDELYRSCYASCGGRVESRTVCVANCDEAR